MQENINPATFNQVQCPEGNINAVQVDCDGNPIIAPPSHETHEEKRALLKRQNFWFKRKRKLFEKWLY